MEFEHVRCLGHIINLIVNNAIKRLQTDTESIELLDLRKDYYDYDDQDDMAILDKIPIHFNQNISEKIEASKCFSKGT